MNRTPIEWCRTYAADGSFEEGFSVNPVRFRPRGTDRLVTMCQKVSPGCTHCYAETITRRFWPKDADVDFPGYTALGVLAGEFVLDEKALQSVLSRKKPARIFWGDMTDLFGEWVPDVFLDRCNAVVALTPHLTHMFLTKRTGRAHMYYGRTQTEQMVRQAMIGMQVGAIHLERTGVPVSEWSGLPMPNLWLGTSIENPEQARIRAPLLARIPAGIRYFSVEPLLDFVDITPYLEDTDWVIVGGESGGAARAMNLDWVRDLRDQCAGFGVPFFFKQVGGVNKKAAGALLDGKEYREFPGVAIG